MALHFSPYALHYSYMARKILKSPESSRNKLKFYFPKKILWNPYTWLDKKAKRIPRNIVLAVIFFVFSFFLLREEKIRMEKRILGLQTKIKADQKNAFDWEQILIERPDYRDGWIQLSALYHKLGDIEKAKEALARAKALDPSNETILSFEELLENW